MSKKLNEPKVVRDGDQIHWLVIRSDDERVGGFKSQADAWRYIDRGDHLPADQKRHQDLRRG